MEKVSASAYSSTVNEVTNKLSEAMNKLDSVMSVKCVDMTIGEAFIVGKNVFTAMEASRKAIAYLNRHERY